MSIDDALTVAAVGEFTLIERLTAALPVAVRHARVRLGIGDDAAIWSPTAGHELVITIDSLIEAIHFRLDWTDWRSLGHKSLAVNLSDLAAMGARPAVAVISLGLRGDERVADLVAFYEGLGALAERDGITLAGGDIVRSPQAVMISVTAIGEVPVGQALTRGGAQPGDVIAVSGTLGVAAAGLQLLLDGERDGQARTTTGDQLIAAQLRPEPRLALGAILREAGASAAMDLSDGLLGDLPKLLTASRVQATLVLDQVPVAAAIRVHAPDAWEELALRGGEDYELLFTASPVTMNEITARAHLAGAAVTAIGHISAADPADPAEIGRIALERDGETTLLPAGAFDHFRAD